MCFRLHIVSHNSLFFLIQLDGAYNWCKSSFVRVSACVCSREYVFVLLWLLFLTPLMPRSAFSRLLWVCICLFLCLCVWLWVCQVYVEESCSLPRNVRRCCKHTEGEIVLSSTRRLYCCEVVFVSLYFAFFFIYSLGLLLACVCACLLASGFSPFTWKLFIWNSVFSFSEDNNTLHNHTISYTHTFRYDMRIRNVNARSLFFVVFGVSRLQLGIYVLVDSVVVI